MRTGSGCCGHARGLVKSSVGRSSYYWRHKLFFSAVAQRRFGKSKMSFKIQAEAAVRVWQVLRAYRDIRRKGQAARLGWPSEL